MIDAGAIQGVSAIAGVHVWPDSPSGTITTRVPSLPTHLHPFLSLALVFSSHMCLGKLFFELLYLAARV